jgi:hypothetical protein
MSWPGKTRLEIECALFDALEEAQARYQRLSEEYRRMADEGSDILDNGDGKLALARSAEKHREVQWAIEEYTKALTRFREVVVEGKLPEDCS